MPRQLRVFLCHSSKDKPAVRDLYNKLQSQPWIDPWLDEEKLLPGQDWHEEIEKAVEITDVVVVFLSNHSVTQEGYVQRELKLALDVADEKTEGTIFVIPLRLEDCPAPRRLRGWHYEDYFPSDRRKRVFERLLLSLKLRYEQKYLHVIEREADKVRIPIKEEDSKPKKPAAKTAVEKKSYPTFKPNLRGLGIVSASIVFLLLAIYGGYYLIKNLPSTVTDIWINTISATPASGIGPVKISEKDSMTLVYIPGGEFKMGTSDDEHQVYLDPFWIDKTEVTNAMYAKCVEDSVCTPPSASSSYSRKNYYGNSDFDNYPVIYVNWFQAGNYCKWVGRELPTEAQWERAARGTDGRTYPWGEEINCNKANFGFCVGDTAEVGSYPDSASSNGTLDMAGNVWEWVNDWFDESYYLNSQSSNPPGPDSGDNKVIRGGSWGYYDHNLHTTYRRKYNPISVYYNIGFRCSLSP